MTIPSSTAGKACAECGIPDPCIFDVVTDFPERKEKHAWSKEGVAHFNLLDSGSGCNGTIAITYQCDKSATHHAWLEEASENNHKNLMAFGTPNNVTLCYEGQKGGLSIIDAFRSPWDYLGSITTPFDIFDEPAHYTVVINSCYECGRYVEIDVYPTLEIRFTTGLSYEISSSKRIRTVKERRDERIKSREAMENTKPKNKNKLRSGWQNTTAEFEWINKTSLTVELGLKVANVDYTHEYEEAIKKRRQVKELEQIGRIDSLIKKINKYFAPDPDNEDGTRKYALFSAKIEPVKLGVSYAYQYTDIKDGPCHFYGLYGKPFFEASFRFDIISFICAYCKIESLVNRCREYLRKHGTSVECYIEISPGIDLDLGAVYSEKDKEWEFNTKDSNIYLGLKGEVSATFEADVFVVTLHAEASASIEAKAGFGFDAHDDGLDLALYHDGIKGIFAFKADITYGPERGEVTKPKKENEREEEWPLCAPMEKKDSPLRVNLYGKSRPVEKKVTPPEPVTIWPISTDY
ncbi:hypothetical protein BJK63_22650 [Salmonella enterica]|nr:hypothetical protein [Salmonella enterica]EDR0326746.1 hypothetical protein [Salmonella enterica subsp. houtenae]EDV1134267.1 hypothetical protein [Salmonella enterica subsp. houtenae]EDV5803234.1 hypothetical protein [Salmonella enterica subsp. houtenae]EDV6280801.1 hypothetical protein [Salmonella enterica subsp. houtenae]